MLWVVIKNMFRVLVVNFIAFIAMSLLTGLLMLLMSVFGVAIKVNIWWTLAGAIPAAVMVFLYAWLLSYLVTRDGYKYKKAGKKYIGINKFRAINCLPLVVGLSAVLLFIALIIMAYIPAARDILVKAAYGLSESFGEKLSKSESVLISDIGAFFGIFFSNIAICQIGTYIVIMEKYRKTVMCPKCKNVFSMVEYSYDSSSSESTQYKTRTDRKQVGSITGFGEEVGVYADVQTTTAQTIVTERRYHHCKCAVCGEEITRHEKTVAWKK